MTSKTNRPNAAELRHRAEVVNRENEAMSPENFAAGSPAENQQLLHELRVHQIELEMQNEELREAQVELEASRTRFVDLYDLAPVGYITVSEVGAILEANLTAAALLGVARGTLVGRMFTRFILPEDQDTYYHHRKQLFETGQPQRCELRLLRPNSPPFWARLDATRTPDKSGAPACYVVLSDITERKGAEEQLKHALQEKEILLRELYHRTKNNMMAINSMLNLQAGRTDNGQIKTILREVENRVTAMAMIHQKLYQARDLSHVQLHNYVDELARHLLHSYNADPSRIQLRYDLEPIPVLIDVAIPCSLILNELISNALKHAFPADRAGEIYIQLRQTEQDGFELVVADDGVGVPAGFDLYQQPTLGLQIILGLGQHQLGGTVRFETQRGFACYFRLANARQ